MREAKEWGWGGREREGGDGLPHAAGGQRRRGATGEGLRPPRVLAPLQGSSLFLHLKSLRDGPAPPAGGGGEEGEGEGPRWAGQGGARALWKALFPGKQKERKKREGGVSAGGNMAAAAERKEGRWRRTTGGADERRPSRVEL